MHRKKASPIARHLVSSELLRLRHLRRILDYGCGIGQDVAFYRDQGYEAIGFDPHRPFGFSQHPVGTFDLVTCLFVLNVIATSEDRRAVCRQISNLVAPSGLLVVATRSPQAISSEALAKNWLPFKDGYLSSPTRGTFQRGISVKEIQDLIQGPVLELSDVSIPSSPDSCVAVFQKNPF